MWQRKASLWLILVFCLKLFTVSVLSQKLFGEDSTEVTVFNHSVAKNVINDNSINGKHLILMPAQVNI